MDIGQFGKVLKSRFPDRKRRRGKQGAQLYVYKDVALKVKQGTKIHVDKDVVVKATSHITNNPTPDTSKSSKQIEPDLLKPPVSIHPKKKWLLHRQSQVTTEETEEDRVLGAIPKTQKIDFDGRASCLQDIQSSEVKSNSRKLVGYNIHEINNMNHLNQYSLRSKIQQDNNPNGTEEFEIEIDSSQRENVQSLGKDASPVKTNIAADMYNLQQVHNNVGGMLEKNCLNTYESNNAFQNNEQPNYYENYRKTHPLQNPTFHHESGLAGTKDGTSGVPTIEDNNAELIIDMSQFCLEQQLKSEIEVMDIPITDEYPQPNGLIIPSIGNGTGSSGTENVVTSSNHANVKYPNDAVGAVTVTQNENRMAIGRKWLDANLIESPGSKIYAKDIESAYARDYPAEPLLESSMTILIRSKFPGKRKRVVENGENVYIYQDLALVSKAKEVNNEPKLTQLPADTVNPSNIESKPFDSVYQPSPHAVIVTQPNINTFVCSPPVNSIFSYPCVAVQVMQPINSSQYENYGHQNVKPNVNMTSSSVNMGQPLNLNHGISYILPNSTSSVQPLQFAHVQGQPISQPIQTMKLPFVNEQNTFPTTIPAVRFPTAPQPNPFQIPFSSHKGASFQIQGPIPIRKKKANTSPIKVPNISPKVQQKGVIPPPVARSTCEMPVKSPKKTPENYSSNILTYNVKSDPNDGSSPKVTSSSLSPLMKVLKDEPKIEANSVFSEHSSEKLQLYNNDAKTVPPFDSEKVQKMLDSILPDMDVDDFISYEISESKKNSTANNTQLHNVKSTDTKANHASSSPSDCYYNKHRKDKRKDNEEVSSTATSVSFRTHPQSLSHKPEIITVSDNIYGDSFGNHKKTQSPTKKDKPEKVRKPWDEDLRKNITDNIALQKQNSSKQKKQLKHKKRALFADFKEPIIPRPEYTNNYLQDHPSMHCGIQRDKQEIRPSESNGPKRVLHPCRMRDLHMKNMGDIGAMPTSISSVPNMQAYPRPNGSLQQLQMMPSKINLTQTSPTSSSASGILYNNHTNSRPEYGSLMYEQAQQQAVNTVLQTVKYVLRDIGQSWSESEIAWRLESALYDENPAVMYIPGKPIPQFSNDTTQDAFPCCGSQSLRELARSSFDIVDPLLHHQQTCQGLGCSEKCRTLRGAYTHIYIFRHRCQVWYTFARIFIKHSRVCRVARCTLPLCLFMKHELHLNGISVLSMHFKEEQHVLEDLFRRCEKLGQHTADLQCRHLLGIDHMGLGDPCMMIPAGANLRRSDANSHVREIRMLMEEAHQKNISQTASRMLQVIMDMLRLHT